MAVEEEELVLVMIVEEMEVEEVDVCTPSLHASNAGSKNWPCEPRERDVVYYRTPWKAVPRLFGTEACSVRVCPLYQHVSKLLILSLMLHKRLINPILNHLDSETWHQHAVDVLHGMEVSATRLKILQLLAQGRMRYKDKRLHTRIGNVALENPVMVGAGWDKQGRAVCALHAVGFAGVEVGSVLQHPQHGNPEPRQFMIGDGVCLNHLGFNSAGMEAVAQHLERYRHDDIPIGISIGKNKEVQEHDAPAAHAVVAEHLAPYASYMGVDLSSPNTPNLRALQEKGPLRDIVQAVCGTLAQKGYTTDVYVKIAPDLTLHAVDDVMKIAIDEGLAGIIASNTTIRPDLKARYGERWRGEAGGLSGDNAEFRAMSTRQIAHIYRQSQGRLSLIGVGGIKDAMTALEKIRAGASAVQLVTALRGEGLGVANAINRGIVRELSQKGAKSLREMIGIDV